MKILAVDTSTLVGSVALVDGEKLAAELTFQTPPTHAEQLLPAIEQILRTGKWTMGNLQGLALSLGPGSFTSLRIALSTLKGMAHAHSLPLVGLSTLEVLAQSALISALPVVPLLDAKRGEVYAAVYRFANGKIDKILFQEQSVKPEILCNTLKKFRGAWLLGEGAIRYRSLFEETLRDKALFAPNTLVYPQARWVAYLALPLLKKGEGKNWTALTPNYLRAPDTRVPSPVEGREKDSPGARG